MSHSPGQSEVRHDRSPVRRAMVWMALLAALLFWVPVIGPAIAGYVGGRAGRTTGAAALAAALPAAIVTAIVVVAVLVQVGPDFSTLEYVLACIVQVVPLFVGVAFGASRT